MTYHQLKRANIIVKYLENVRVLQGTVDLCKVLCYLLIKYYSSQLSGNRRQSHKMCLCDGYAFMIYTEVSGFRFVVFPTFVQVHYLSTHSICVMLASIYCMKLCLIRGMLRPS